MPHENRTTAPMHESSEVRGRGFVIFLIGFAVLGVVSHLVIYYGYGFLHNLRKSAPGSPLAQILPVPPDPQVEGSAVHPDLPATNLQELRNYENMRLQSYGWIDKNSGVVHIPINRAMEIVLERGLPSFGKTTTKSQG